MHEPIRILHMIGSLDIGGSQAMIMNVYRAIDRDKVQFDFILDHPEQRALVTEVEKLGGKVYDMPTFVGTNIGQIRKTWNAFFDEHSEYKILHSHVRSYASLYLPIAKKHGLKTIIHSHSDSNGTGIQAYIKDVLQYPIRFQADYFFACSEAAGKWLFGEKVVQSNRYKTIPNAIDVNAFTYNRVIREKIRKELGYADEFVIGHVGRMTEPKNHAFLIDVFESVAEQDTSARLLLIGDGGLLETVKERVRQKKLENKVIFLGGVDATKYYQAMDCFVFPSLWEGLGMAVIEAQASGLPCVVSNAVPIIADVGAGLFNRMPLGNLEVKDWKEKVVQLKKCNRATRLDGNDLKTYDIQKNALKLRLFYEDL